MNKRYFFVLLATLLWQSFPKEAAALNIALVGQPIIVFDHLKDKQIPEEMPDAQVTAWKNADGTVNLTIPHFEEYRMRGPDLEHLTSDPNEIFSSTMSASNLLEDHYNYHHWFSAPYTLDGKTVYVLTHSEWYACLLNGDCKKGHNQLNSWVTSTTSFKSTNGGQSWSANGLNQGHLIVDAGDVWTGSRELALKVYQKALNHSGIMTPTRIIKEGNYYYSIGFYIHRDFSKLNIQTDEAPIDKYGYMLMRTKDITKAQGWEAWVSGSTFDDITKLDFNTFLPTLNGTTIDTSQPQIIFDVKSKLYILIFTPWGNNGPVYYITTKSLANPSWSKASAIAGTGAFKPDPRGPGKNNPCNTGFGSGNYVSVIDTKSSGNNFEFTQGDLWMFYVVNPAECGGNNLARDIYRVKLVIN